MGALEVFVKPILYKP